MLYAGQFDAAIEHCQRAARLSPQDPLLFQMDACIAHAHFTAGRLEEALAWAESAMSRRSTNSDALLGLMVSLVCLGREQEAEAALSQYQRVEPVCSLRNVLTTMPFVHPEHSQTWDDALRRAGLPE